MDVQGSCTDNFFPIKDLFKKYLEEVDEGAGFSVVKNNKILINIFGKSKNLKDCLLYTSPSPRDLSTSRMPSSA